MFPSSPAEAPCSPPLQGQASFLSSHTGWIQSEEGKTPFPHTKSSSSPEQGSFLFLPAWSTRWCGPVNRVQISSRAMSGGFFFTFLRWLLAEPSHYCWLFQKETHHPTLERRSGASLREESFGRRELLVRLPTGGKGRL